jgi:acyl-coenzyme A synthetase/AMP-(fatty) acid ligase/acyl carrier protein
MGRERITIYHSVPTAYRRFVETLQPEERSRLAALRWIVLGGEAAYQSDLESYQKHFSAGTRFVNLHGSTESTINSLFVADHQTRVLRATLPIGEPIEGIEMLLLDARGEPTEVYGEIAIRSPHVALGYWQRPELTEQVFRRDARGQRIYCTGDLGRRLPDGTLECVGRKDFQLKIRGFRVEPGEVESTLAGHPALQDVAVIGQALGGGENRLVAYWVARPGASVTGPELRAFLKARLPDYLVPANFVGLPAMPLTPNGKLDRRALPAPEETAPERVKDFVAPRTPMEQTLAEFWCEILGVKTVGIHDDFFELGGHSLRVMQLVARIRDAYEIDLPLRRVFETPTIADLALALTEQLLAAEDDDLEGLMQELQPDAGKDA